MAYILIRPLSFYLFHSPDGVAICSEDVQNKKRRRKRQSFSDDEDDPWDEWGTPTNYFNKRINIVSVLQCDKMYFFKNVKLIKIRLMTVLMSIIPAPMKKPYGHMMTSTMQGLPKVPTTSYPMTTALRLTVATNQQRLMMIQ